MKRRCQRLDETRKRCGGIALRVPFYYHGNSEIYTGFEDRPVAWVAVYLCRKCAESAAESQLKERAERRKKWPELI